MSLLQNTAQSFFVGLNHKHWKYAGVRYIKEHTDVMAHYCTARTFYIDNKFEVETDWTLHTNTQIDYYNNTVYMYTQDGTVLRLNQASDNALYFLSKYQDVEVIMSRSENKFFLRIAYYENLIPYYSYAGLFVR